MESVRIRSGAPYGRANCVGLCYVRSTARLSLAAEAWMRRRKFSTLLVGAATVSAVWPSHLSAQKTTPVIGYLYGGGGGYSFTPVGAVLRRLSATPPR